MDRVFSPLCHIRSAKYGHKRTDNCPFSCNRVSANGGKLLQDLPKVVIAYRGLKRLVVFLVSKIKYVKKFRIFDRVGAVLNLVATNITFQNFLTFQ